ncbi:hypothetical protein AB3N02_22495 [Priestia aryabhattai]|uniref:hypothetical protein n=1 Tax=Priestia aryabhattai TaxID=412384 RepID=UPI0039A3AB34
MVFTKQDFARLVINELSSSRVGRSFLKKYKQSEVREFVENYKLERNQRILREISQSLFARSPQYQRLLRYFSDMSLFAHIITPIKDIRKLNKGKVSKQYVEIGELLRLMNLRHEMTKVLRTAFLEDTFFGYVHRDKKSFYIQKIDASICKITSVEDVYNYSVDMSHFQKDEKILPTYPNEIQVKYKQWRALKDQNPTLEPWVELDAKNTICIKINEEMIENFPPFAGSFDAIFDIEAFKELRKDKEELGNYMVLTQQLPIRTDSEDNNDFAIDMDMMNYFHNMLADTVPDNIGVATSPMKIEALKFDKDRADSDGVAKSERDFWSGNGTSQLLFNADKSTSSGLLMSIKTDEEIVFGVLTQIERWVNRYLKFEYSDLMFNARILHVTHFNRDDMYKMYLETAQYGVPVKSHLSATVGLDPIEVMNMSFLENDMLKMHEEWVPLMSSHTMGAEGLEQGATTKTPGKSGNSAEGRPTKDKAKVSDETARSQDKPNATPKK